MPIGDQIIGDKQIYSEDLRSKYDDLIKEAILRAKTDLEVTRADDVDTPGVITNDILKRLMPSDYVVADITYPNPNVFYELGLRHACKTGTILIKEKCDVHLPFDISHSRHIEYENTATGLKKLSLRLKKQFEWFENNKDAPDNQFIELANYIKPKSLNSDNSDSQKDEDSKITIADEFDIIDENSYGVGSGISSIIQDALKYNESMRDTLELDSVFGLPSISVVGCGDAGNNIINRLYNMGIKGAETIAINTVERHLSHIRADKKILIGKTLARGLGTGGYPEIGTKCAELARDTLEGIFKESDLVFVIAGMGGGTGTGVAPVVAEIAKEQGAIVIGVVSTPFKIERVRTIKAEEGIKEFRRAADTVIVLDNNRLIDHTPNLTIEQAYSVMDQLIAETVIGITECIAQPSLINLDYADIRAIMGGGGFAIMFFGGSDNKGKNNDVARMALNQPLFDADYRNATGSLIHITGGPDLNLKEAEEIAASLTYELSPNANIIWGARIRDDYEGKIRVIAIMTGLQNTSFDDKSL